ncbi:Membrane protein FAM174B Precursor [Channa argus]|uniref:Membrane protein FAM174B n=1 Tax=Channa argus TaxID=215402 RepID=A0A6G1PFR6_CHAAH|nr:Membrane protein FAM174B Precursor [Channa argus]
MAAFSLALTFIIVALWRVSGEPQTISSPATQFNSTSLSSSSISSEDDLRNNGTDATVGSRISSLMTHLPTLQNIVIFICVLTAALITCLVIKVIRSGRRIRKTRKYDIITTPAERVEMAPLNEENDDEEDSTLFDVKYRHHRIEVYWYSGHTVTVKMFTTVKCPHCSPLFLHKCESQNGYLDLKTPVLSGTTED